MVNRSQHNSWKKQQSKSHSNPSQNSWKQRKSAAPVEPVPKHRSIRCMAEGPTPCRSIFSGWRQKSSEAPVEPMVMKSKHRCNESPLFQRACFGGLQLSSAPVEPTLRNQSTGAMKVLCSREHVWWTPTSLQHRLNRRFRIKAPVHWMYFVPERLFELISEPLQHRLNRCPYGACTGVMTQA